MLEEKKYYLTKKKLKELKEEYKNLLKLESLKTRGEVPKILESEDVSSEYLVFQEDLNFLKARIGELKKILNNYELIKYPSKAKQKIVALGAKVKVEADGEKDEFTIVGTLEANPSIGKISNESPVGKALMGRKVGDEIVVSSPIKTTYKILKISYPRLEA